MIKTFRGLLADGGSNRIRLSTKTGKIGYRILKFLVIAKDPGTVDQEATITIKKVSFTPVDPIDLSDGNVLGVAFYSGAASAKNYPTADTIIFDQEIFNQDIFIGNSMTQPSSGGYMNYYIELETINMTDNAAAVSTLRDIRSG
tara:strand:+ start:1186 stop:1617 length:432 start_codon:yes stop_codon:yes gene_type:complete